MKMILNIVLPTVAAIIMAAACTPLEPAAPRPGAFPSIEEKTTGSFADGETYVVHRAASDKPYVIIFLPDGYTRAELTPDGPFMRVVREATDAIFSEEPLCRMKDMVEVRVRFLATSKSGVGSPDSRFKVSLDHYNILSYDKDAAVSFAIPGITAERFKHSTIVIIPNSTERPGVTRISGVFPDVSTVSILAPSTPELNRKYDYLRFGILHEVVGHGIGLLSDEYANINADASGAVDFSAIQLSSFIQNVWPAASGAPWEKYIGLPGYGDTGYFEGGCNYKKGIWRSSEVSIMTYEHDRCPSFNAVSREAIHRRVCEANGIAWTWEKFLEFDREYVLGKK